MLAQIMDLEGWDSLCIFADVLELSIDPRFQNPGQRLGEGITEDDSIELRATLKAAFMRKSTKEWLDFLNTQPEIIWERVRSWQEVLEDEQNYANDYLTNINLPDGHHTTTVGNVISLSETPGSVKGGPPQLGEGNDEILGELGFSKLERDKIKTHAMNIRENTFKQLSESSQTN